MRIEMKEDKMEQPVSEWTTQQVADWLHSEKFDKSLQQQFVEHKIDGIVLMHMTEHDLRSEPLRLKHLGDIKRLSVLLRSLQHRKVSFRKRDSTIRPVGGASANPHLIYHTSDNDSDEAASEDSEAYAFTSTHTMSGGGSDSGGNTASSWSVHKAFKFLPELRYISPEEREAKTAMLAKLSVSLLFAMLAIFCTALTMVVVHDRLPDPTSYPPLPDIVLDNVPLMTWAFKMSEAMCVIMVVMLLVILATHTHRAVILRRLFAIFGTVFILRCVTMFVTSLSVPGTHLSQGCMEMRNIPDTFESKLARAFDIAKGLGTSLAGVQTCGDYMFSGHSSVLTLLNFFITEYTPQEMKGLHLVTWSLNLFGMFFVLASHEHYSIDVFVAFYISSRLFLYYHSLANIQHAIKPSEREKVATWFPLFQYLESNMEGIVPNVYEYPWVPIFSLFRFRRNTYDNNDNDGDNAADNNSKALKRKKVKKRKPADVLIRKLPTDN